jgi:hypothetical protein
MKDPKDIAGPGYPLHASGLATVLRCPWRTAVKYYDEPSGDDSGPAAQTGTLVHRAAEKFHETKDVASGLERMNEVAPQCPLGDVAEAAALYLQYVADPRNRDAEVILCEQQISFTIAPDPSDITGQPIHIVGTLDQVRNYRGKPHLFDIKTSTRDGVTLLAEHEIQVACYCIGASILLKQEVQPGALILPRKYGSRDPRMEPAGVFFHFSWSYSDIETMFIGIRKNIAAIRAGQYWMLPGDWCRFCHQRSPDLCRPKLQEDIRGRRSLQHLPQDTDHA